MRVPRPLGVCAGFGLVFGLFAATPAITAAAAPPPALWVNVSGTPGTDTSCANPGYTSISDALLAAPAGAVINVCSGTYDEQLAITKAVTLRANGAVTVQGPSSPSDTATSCDADGPGNQDVVDICVPGKVVITGFTIVGGWAADVCNDTLNGVAVLGGATLNMSQSTVENIGGDPLTDGCQGGVGIQVGLAISATAADPGHATLTNDTVETYQKNGITVDGKGSSSTMTSVTVEGAGPSTAIAQNGIQVSDGATAAINKAVVTGNECDDTSGGCGSSALAVQSAGILLFDAAKTTVENSTIRNNDMGLYNLEDYAWAFYTPPSPFHDTVETFTNLTLANRYENAVVDAGASAINGSRLSGGEEGLSILQYSGQPTSATVAANHDTITGTSAAAVRVDSDGASGDLPVGVSVTDSSFNLSNAAGVVNNESFSPSVVNATDDWWGNNTGPSVWSFGTGSSVTAWVNFFPWALTSSVNSFKTCTTSLNARTTGNDVVLCAKAAGNATLSNNGNGNVLLLGNNGNDHLNGSAANGETWIIAGQGNNVVNGKNPPGTGGGFIEERGNAHHDSTSNVTDYTVDFD